MFLLAAISVAVALVAGAILLVAGLRPPRRGTTRFCRRCAYNLTGLEGEAASGRCPECGAGLNAPRAVVVGERVRRPGMWATGAVLSALGLAGAATLGVAAARQFDWYTLTPTAWVIEDLRGVDRSRAARAWRELQTRYTAGSLGESKVRQFVAAALDLQARPQRTAFDGDLLGWLTTQYYAKSLHAGERERFLRQMVVGKILMRPRVVANAEFQAQLVVEWRGPNARFLQLPRGFDAKCNWKSIECDGARVPEDKRDVPPIGGSARAQFSGVTNYLWALSHDPGPHRVTVRLDCEVFEAPVFGTTTPAAESVITWEQAFEASYEVLAERPPDFIRRKKSAELDRDVAANVWLDVLTNSDPSLVVNRDIPIGVAFDLWTNDRQVLPSPMDRPPTGRPGEETWNRISLGPSASSSNKVTIRLRASEAAAEKTTDLFEIWDGELVFEDVDLTASGRQKIYPKVRR